MNTPRLTEIDYIKAWVLYGTCATAGGFAVGAVAGDIVSRLNT